MKVPLTPLYSGPADARRNLNVTGVYTNWLPSPGPLTFVRVFSTDKEPTDRTANGETDEAAVPAESS